MLKITRANEPMTVERINLCIYAAPGLGKTSMAFTAADPVLLDFDRGSHRAANRKDVVTVAVWGDVTAINADDLAPYKTVIVDTAGRCLDFLTGDIIGNNPKMGRGGALTLQGYGELKSKFSSWLKLLNTFGKDVVLIAHMDEQRNGDEIIERLDVQGGSKGEIYKSVDAMGRIFIQNNGRVIDFSPRQNSFGKNPCNLGVVPFPDPQQSPTFLGDLMASMKHSLNRMTEEQKAAQGELEEWSMALQDYSTAEDFNRCLPEFKAASQSVKALVHKRAKSLGLTYNKKSDIYEDSHAVAS